jgi:hypothetical protein
MRIPSRQRSEAITRSRELALELWNESTGRLQVGSRLSYIDFGNQTSVETILGELE